MKTFLGYKRSDGKVGVRNHVLILPASMCASDVARMVANNVKNTVAFNNQLGCSQVPSDQKYIMDVMAGYAANPNIYGTIIISLGCENCQMDLVETAIKKLTNKPIKKFIIQEEQGSIRTVEKATRAAMKMVQEASLVMRESCSFADLIIGTECGGSDPTSGLAANILVGEMSNRIVESGGTSILSETTEFIGAEHILAKRAKDDKVYKDIYRIINRYEDSMKLVGEDIRDGNPSPGNKAGGITTLEEKSLGCIHKGGDSVINEVLEYGQIPNEKGLVIMDTPGNDMASIAGMVAGGAQIIVFTSGRGATTGHPISPVIKITGNRITYGNMADNIDIDASAIIYETDKLKPLGDLLMDEIYNVAQGKLTKAEVLGFIETSVMRNCNFV